MIKCLIIEDEEPAVNRLKRLLEKVDSSIEVIAEIDSVKRAVEFLGNGNDPDCDLIFMDIHLADGNAFEIFDLIKVDHPIIFTTAFDHYAIRAFKEQSLAYLLKPIAVPELKDAIHKYQKLYAEQASAGIDYQELIRSLGDMKKQFKKRFLVHKGDSMEAIPTEDIACFYADSGVVWLNAFNGKQFIVPYTVEQLATMLDPDQFFKVNRSFILNENAFEKLVNWSRSRFRVLTNIEIDKEVYLASAKLKDFKAWLEH